MIYEFKCQNLDCDFDTEEISLKVAEFEQQKDSMPCPKCREFMKNIVFANDFHLKGGGWFADNYEKKGRG